LPASATLDSASYRASIGLDKLLQDRALREPDRVRRTIPGPFRQKWPDDCRADYTGNLA
jgi:hypothetical protein